MSAHTTEKVVGLALMSTDLVTAIRRAQLAVQDFHRKFDQAIGDKPAVRHGVFRSELIREECVRELCKALLANDMVGVADGICDSIYVLLGTAVTCGIDLAPLFAAVHAANMAKDGGGKRGDGKVSKPPGWTPPDIAGLLAEQGWDGK